MMGSTLLLAASAMSLPNLGNDTAAYLVRKIDSGGQLDRERSWVAARVHLWLEPNGRISKCSLGETVGKEEFARKVCPLLIGTKVQSPRDHEGKRVHGFLTITFSAFAEVLLPERATFIEALDAEANTTDPDRELVVEGMPVDLKEIVGIYVLVGEDGNVKACEQREASSGAVMPEGCELARAKTFAIRPSGAEGAVSYVRFVRLVAPEPSGSSLKPGNP